MAGPGVPVSHESHDLMRSELDGPRYEHINQDRPAFHPTAYHGYQQGHIDDRSVLSLGSDFDIFDRSSAQLSAPPRAFTPTRPALGSRLLSTLSSAQPAAVALTRKGSLLHSRAKSLAGFMPKLNSTSAAPERPQHSSQATNRIFGDIFSGESAPIRLGIPPSSPTKEESDSIMEYRPSFTERPNGVLRRQSTAPSATGNSTSPSRPSWFSRKQSTPASTPIPASASARQQDGILALDINTSLFPNGPADPLSPHAFNDLLLNATSLLQRMQTAYKEKVDYIASVRPEIDAQKEEVEEAETRSQHLKMQLEDLSRKHEEQKQAMQEVALQLAEEKVRAQEALEAQEAAQRLSRMRRSTDKIGEGDDATPRRRKRGSADSQASDSGFESDADYAESIMSGTLDTPLSPPAVMLTLANGRGGGGGSLSSDRPSSSRQSMASSFRTAYSSQRSGGGGGGGGPDSVVWATADFLRGENRDLRRQVEVMRMTLQGCIDFVGLVKP